MIKLVTLLKRRAELTRPEFEERWLNVHAPIAAGFPDLRGYVLGFSILEGEPGADGVAQLWFDDRASAQRSYASKIGRNGSNDARQNLSRRDHLLVSEHWISDPGAGEPWHFKLMIGIKRLERRSRSDFFAELQGLDAALLRREFGSDALRLCVDEAGKQLNSGVDGILDLFQSEAVFDALLEAWYPDADRLCSAASRYPCSEIGTVLSPICSHQELFLLNENAVVAAPETVQPRRLSKGTKHQ